MTERVQVDAYEIAVGDLIEVDWRGPSYENNELVTYKGSVVSIDGEQIRTARFGFSKSSNVYVFYIHPTPPPQEPKGLGAVIQDNEGDYWVRVPDGDYPWSIGDEVRTWDNVVEAYGPVKVLSDGYTPES